MEFFLFSTAIMLSILWLYALVLCHFKINKPWHDRLIVLKIYSFCKYLLRIKCARYCVRHYKRRRMNLPWRPKRVQEVEIWHTILLLLPLHAKYIAPLFLILSKPSTRSIIIFILQIMKLPKVTLLIREQSWVNSLVTKKTHCLLLFSVWYSLI